MSIKDPETREIMSKVGRLSSQRISFVNSESSKPKGVEVT
jgi:hypothetical protein